MTRFAITAACAVLLAGCTTTDGATTSAGNSPTPPPATVKPPPAAGGQPTLAGAEPAGERCRAASSTAEIPQGGPADPGAYQAWIAVTNAGSGPCTLEGSSELKIFTGGTGSELPIRQVLSVDAPARRLTVQPGGTALMSVEFPTAPPGNVPPECLEGGTFVRFSLPGDSEQIEAWADPALGVFPPVCGAVTVTPWWQHPTG